MDTTDRAASGEGMTLEEFREALRSIAPSLDDVQVAEIELAAGEYGAHLIERYARSPQRPAGKRAAA